MAKFEYIKWLVDFLSNDAFEFDWDEGNSTKNEIRHGINTKEAQEAFFCENILPLGQQYQPATQEMRFSFLSQTRKGIKVFVCFTTRENRVRIINIRVMNKNERQSYEKIC